MSHPIRAPAPLKSRLLLRLYDSTFWGKRVKKQPLAMCIAVFSMATYADHDLPIEIIEVTASATDQAGELQLFSQTPVTRPTHDAGELLRSVTGMTALRRGGRGFEPIIRGQSESNLNVIANGAYNLGACPGRMDPPSTYVGIDHFDQVSIIKGNRSVIYGAGGSGGTLIFEHQRPQFEQRPYQGTISAGYTGNSDLKSSAADIAAGTDKAFIRLLGARKKSDNYDDGDGNTVSSAFESESLGVIFGVDLGASDYLELSHDAAHEDDIWYAGNGMDAVYADSKTSRVKWLHSGATGFIDQLELNLYRSDVNHLMDNYTLRQRNTSPAGMAAPSSSDTWGGRLLTTISNSKTEWRLGVDYLANDRTATLFMDAGKNGSYDSLVSRMWPDVEQRQTGVFSETDYQHSEKDMLRLGIRYDHFESRANDAALAAGMMASATPLNLYQTYYDSDRSDRDSDGIGLVLGWDRQLTAQKLLSVNLSRSVRTPDTTEQWMARSAMGSIWVGNPELDAEIHQQLDLTVMQSFDRTSTSITVFWDEVDDYIERYQSGNATLYRNSDARLRGIEVDAQTALGDPLRLRLGLAYVRGDSDNSNLAQISPLEARINLDYEKNNWAIGAEWVLSDRQKHFNPDVDVNSPSSGFGVLHIYGHQKFADTLTMELGIENVFDKRYAYHVNAANSDPFNPQAIRVNEPGRQLWTKISYTF